MRTVTLSDGVTVGREGWGDAGSNRRLAGIVAQGAAPDAGVALKVLDAGGRATPHPSRP